MIILYFSVRNHSFYLTHILDLAYCLKWHSASGRNIFQFKISCAQLSDAFFFFYNDVLYPLPYYTEYGVTYKLICHR